MVAMRVDRSDATTYTRYFHKDHLGSIATITDAAGAVVERLSYDAWGKRRFPNGQDDPSGSIASQTTRGFTGHEQLTDVGLVHMNGRVYDPMLGRFGTPDPTTENPFSTQGWNRYSYVGNSPLNATDPSGYCWLGCFWQKPFKALGALLRRVPIIGQILQVAAAIACGPAGAICAGLAAAAVTGLASGNLGLALRAGFIAMASAYAFDAVGTATLGLGHPMPDFMSGPHLANILGHAAVGCASAAASGGKCGPGALSAAVGSFVTPLTKGLGFGASLAVTTTAGGLAAVAGGGKFGNGAVTAAFGYLFNALQALNKRAQDSIDRLRTTDRGREIVEGLEKSPRRFSLIIDESVGCQPACSEIFMNGGIAQVNPLGAAWEWEDAGGNWFTRSIDVLAGHELGHLFKSLKFNFPPMAGTSPHYDDVIDDENTIARQLDPGAHIRQISLSS